MNYVTQHYIVDISSNNTFVQVPAVQGDNSTRYVELELIANGVPYEITDDVYPIIVGTKPDTHKILNSCSLTEEGYVLVDITEQMTAVAGVGYYSIMIYDSVQEKQLTSFPFLLVNNPATYDPGYILSTDEFSMLRDTLAKLLADYSFIITEAGKFGVMAKSYAIGGTGSRDNEDNDNAKKYCEDASVAASSASQSAATATTKATEASDSAAAALTSEGNAKTSEDNAKDSEERSQQIKDDIEDETKNFVIALDSYFDADEIDLMDDTPTEGSKKGVTSDGIYKAINKEVDNIQKSITAGTDGTSLSSIKFGKNSKGSYGYYNNSDVLLPFEKYDEDVLWINSSTENNFEAQEVPLDIEDDYSISDYKIFKFICIDTPTQRVNIYHYLCSFGDLNTKFEISSLQVAASAMCGRSAYIKDDLKTLKINNALIHYFSDSYRENDGINNSLLIPYLFIGIKF